MNQDQVTQLREIARQYSLCLLEVQRCQQALNVLADFHNNLETDSATPHEKWKEPYLHLGNLYEMIAKLEKDAVEVVPSFRAHMLLCWAPNVIGRDVLSNTSCGDLLCREHDSAWQICGTEDTLCPAGALSGALAARCERYIAIRQKWQSVMVVDALTGMIVHTFGTEGGASKIWQVGFLSDCKLAVFNYFTLQVHDFALGIDVTLQVQKGPAFMACLRNRILFVCGFNMQIYDDTLQLVSEDNFKSRVIDVGVYEDNWIWVLKTETYPKMLVVGSNPDRGEVVFVTHDRDFDICFWEGQVYSENKKMKFELVKFELVD